VKLDNTILDHGKPPCLKLCDNNVSDHLLAAAAAAATLLLLLLLLLLQ
jgi:hypothetical protein